MSNNVRLKVGTKVEHIGNNLIVGSISKDNTVNLLWKGMIYGVGFQVTDFVNVGTDAEPKIVLNRE